MEKNKSVLQIKLIIIYILTGAVCGLIGTLFSKSISLVTNIRLNNPWLIYFLPLAGIVSVIIYKYLNVSGMGTNQVIKAADGKDTLSPKLAPAVFIASALSHICGASVGREGAALQLGGSVATFLSKKFKLSKETQKTLIYCGMAGVFSSVFGTPIAAAIFALEVVCVGKINYKAVVPTFISSAVSYFVATIFGAHAERFILPVVPVLNFSAILKTLALSISTVVVSLIFILCLKCFKKLFKILFKNAFLSIVAGAGLTILLTVIIGNYDYNGAGINVIERIVNNNQFEPAAFALKILFTSIAVAAGFKGGEIVPTLFIGATFGALMGSLLAFPVSFSAAVCMITLFCCVTNCPLASIFLAVELFSGNGIEYILISVLISFLLSGKISLYSAQKTIGFKNSPYLFCQKCGEKNANNRKTNKQTSL